MPTKSESTPHSQPRLISVIIPCFNESANLRDSVEAVTQVLTQAGERYEVIVIDDGSRDDSAEIARALAALNSDIKPIELMRNFGQSIAYQTGLEVAVGDYVLFFSGDLEIPAGELLRVIESLDAGHDFVNTSRKDRWGGSHALKSRLANNLLNRITGIDFKDRGSGVKGMRREIAKSINLYGEWHRFIPDLASIFTERLTEIEVPFQERKFGISSYRGKLKSISVFLDLATVAFTVLGNRKPYLLLPGRLFGFTGLIIGAFGFAVSAWLSFQKVFLGASLADRPLFMVSILTLILGFIMVMIGTLGELVMQTYARIHENDCLRIRRFIAPRSSDSPKT